MSEAPQVHSVVLKRVFDAPIDLVYRAWTEAEHVTRWMKCDAEVTLEVENWVPAVGTEFKTHMFKEGAFEAWGTGRFTEVDPPRVLAYTNDADPEIGAPEMSVRVELVDLDGKTELTLTHSGVPTDLTGIIEGGWTTGLSLLQDLAMALLSAYAGARFTGKMQSGDAEAVDSTTAASND